MTWKIGMPNLGHTMDEGKIARWLKQVGDPVAKGEVIVVVESDKANFDVESPADGMLIAIEAADESVVPVGATIGVVGNPSEPRDRIDEASNVIAPNQSKPVAPVPPNRNGRADRVRISPAARALALELRVEPKDIVASSPDGIITRDDVRAHAAAGGVKPVPEATATPLSPMRRAIGDATERAWRTIPRVALNTHADVSALLETKVAVTAVIGRAVALALAEHKSFNGWLRDDGFTASGSVDLGFAVTTGNGLVTAIVPRAETKSAASIDAELKQIAQQARAGTLDGGRMLGGSFTISSLGRWGVDSFDPIIPPPQVAILGVGRINQVAREATGGGVRFASELQLTLVFDHRANDGVEAAQLLQSIVALLENPARMEAGA